MPAWIHIIGSHSERDAPFARDLRTRLRILENQGFVEPAPEPAGEMADVVILLVTPFFEENDVARQSAERVFERARTDPKVHIVPLNIGTITPPVIGVGPTWRGLQMIPTVALGDMESEVARNRAWVEIHAALTEVARRVQGDDILHRYLYRHPDLRDYGARLSAVFLSLRPLLHELKGLKSLHDQLQDVQVSALEPLRRDQGAPLELREKYLTYLREKTAPAPQGGTLHSLRLARIHAIAQKLSPNVADTDANYLLALDAIIRQELCLLAHGISVIRGSLPIEVLRDAAYNLKRVMPGAISQKHRSRIPPFTEKLDAFYHRIDCLSALINLHSSHQELDDGLSYLYEHVTSEHVGDRWKQIVPKDHVERIEKALAKSPERVKDLLHELWAEASQRFRQVDQDLLQQTGILVNDDFLTAEHGRSR